MPSDILLFLVNIILSLFGAALLLRAWAYASRLHPFNPFSQAIFKVTDWLVAPLHKVVRGAYKVDWPSLIACYLSALTLSLLSFLLKGGMAHLAMFVDILPQLLLLALFTTLRWILSLILWVTIAQALMSWINPQAPFMPLLRILTEPLLAPIRRFMPDLGGLDLSPLVVLILTQVGSMILHSVSSSVIGA